MTNSADPDQLASEEANWSGSTLFAKTGHGVLSKRRVKPLHFACMIMTSMQASLALDRKIIQTFLFFLFLYAVCKVCIKMPHGGTSTEYPQYYTPMLFGLFKTLSQKLYF